MFLYWKPNKKNFLYSSIQIITCINELVAKTKNSSRYHDSKVFAKYLSTAIIIFTPNPNTPRQIAP